MTGRFASPELLVLGRPPSLAVSPYNDLLEAARVKLVADMAAAGIDYDVSRLETDPGMIVTQVGVYRDLLRRNAIDDAIAQTYLGSASGGHLDQRAADYGVLRRSLEHVGDEPAPTFRPANIPPAWTWDASAQLWREDDESLRTLARLAWEALSVAGPPGAYAYHAGAAHPAVDGGGLLVVGPETEIVEPGEVLVVVKSHLGNGVPTLAMLDAIAQRLDAYEIIDAAGASTLRLVRTPQGVRPLCARVTVQACQPLVVPVTATLTISAGPDPEAIRATALARLTAYFAQRRRVGARISREALFGVLGVADAGGLPVVEDIAIASPAADIVPTHLQLPVAGTLTLTTVLV